MIPHGVEIFVSLDPVDLRWGFDTLAGIVQERLGRSPRSGALFVFFGRRRTAVKVFFADRSGLCVFYKRLDGGTYRLPQADSEGVASVRIEERVLEDLLDGIDIEQRRPRKTGGVRLH